MQNELRTSVAARIAPALAVVLLGALGGALLAGCGQKGPLTLPPPPAAASAAAAS